ELKDDLPAFVDVSEFAEEVEIDGIKCPAQLSTYTADKSNRLSETFAGLHGEFEELFFQTEPYLNQHQKLPHRGDIVVVNGARFEVVRSEDELGLMHLILSAYRSNKPRFGDRRND
ncbi:MAG: hypothetical protein IJG33_00065, partial [Selenomonadaceae bacterium]|nr:hypothetical protein [Selenomonadaceae bacterium]